MLSSLSLLLTAPLALAHPAQRPFRTANDTRVPVALGVMSRCPDALTCESVLDGVFRQQDVFAKIALELDFIASFSDSNGTDSFECKHGPAECAGNVHELCAFERAGKGGVPVAWQFVQCLNYAGKDRIGDEAEAERCAGVVGLPWDGDEGLAACIRGDLGSELFRESIDRAHDKGFEKSCTIMINGKTCLRDDNQWKDCDTGHSVSELVQVINDEYARLNP